MFCDVCGIIARPTKVEVSTSGTIYERFDARCDWNTAKQLCEARGGHLVTITSQEEQDIVDKLAPSGPNAYHAGAYCGSDRVWKWVTGEAYSYEHWDSEEPNNMGGDQDRLQVYYNGLWDDCSVSQGASNGFICEIQPESIIASLVRTFDGRVYERIDTSCSWQLAKEICEARGGHLATITSAAEQEFVAAMVYDGPFSSYFLGATDEVVEDEWRWVTGEAFSYDNWYKPYQPDNYNGSEHYLEMRNSDCLWNDCTAAFSTTRGFVCEYDNSDLQPAATITAGGKTYERFDNIMSWDQAESFCEARGGHLVTITSAEEQATVVELLSGATRQMYAIGLSDAVTEKDWRWVTGEAFSYDNWSANEPGGGTAENYAYIAGEPFSSVSEKVVGDWLDADGFHASRTLGFICERGDNLIKTQPADASALVGADATFTVDVFGEAKGYLWEVSRDGGDSWEAADNGREATFAISSEADLLVRCTVTFADDETSVSDTAKLAVSDPAPVAYRYANGHFYEVYDQGSTWQQAKQYCENRGGHLATVTSDEELSVIRELRAAGALGRYYLGATYEESEKAWKWVTGEDWSCAPWAGNQPDNYNGIENCLEIWSDDNWNDCPGSFSGARGFICEYEDMTAPEPAATITYNGVTYERFEQGCSDWFDAEEFCEARGGHLVSITSEDENEAVKGLLDGTQNTYKIGCSSADKDGKWRWVTGEEFAYDKWGIGEPSNTDGIEHYGFIVGKGWGSLVTGDWNDASQAVGDAGFICEIGDGISCGPIKAAPAITDVTVTDITPDGYTVSCRISSNSGLTKVQFPTWSVSNGQDDIVWYDVDGQDGVYTLHVSINNHKGDRAYYKTHIYAWDAYGNQSCVNANNVLVPRAVATLGCSTYYVVPWDLADWSSAEAYCEESWQGGHLPVITSAEECEAVRALVASVNDGSYQGYWLGATDAEEDGTWKWVTGETFAFSPWASGEPNGGSAENYLVSYVGGTWNDTRADCDRISVVMEVGSHDLAEAKPVQENVVSPTCTENGSYDEVTYCPKCGHEGSSVRKSIDATGHDWSDWATVTASTTEREGVEARTCRNDDTHVESRAIPVKEWMRGDINGNGVLNVVDAQIVYDLACGVYTSSMAKDAYDLFPCPDGMELASVARIADANENGYLDAQDAYVIQRAVLYGWDAVYSVSDWTKASEALEGAKVVDTKWTYDLTTYTTVTIGYRYNYYRWCSNYDGIWNQDSCWVNSSSYKETVSLDYALPSAANVFGDLGGNAAGICGPYGTYDKISTSSRSYWWLESTTPITSTTSSTTNMESQSEPTGDNVSNVIKWVTYRVY